MGDVGSAFCGFLLAVLPLAVRADAVPEILPVAVLALWPFIFDTTLTLLRRLRAGENIFQAHRSHLYQRLVIAGWPHRSVASLYGGLAAFGATVAVAPLLDPGVRRAADHVAAAGDTAQGAARPHGMGADPWSEWVGLAPATGV